MPAGHPGVGRRPVRLLRGPTRAPSARSIRNVADRPNPGSTRRRTALTAAYGCKPNSPQGSPSGTTRSRCSCPEPESPVSPAGHDGNAHGRTSSRRTWSTATSPGRDRTSCGSPTSPNTRPARARCTARSCSTFSRRVVGWSIDVSPTAALVTNALGMAIDSARPHRRAAVIHSDRGTQFGSWAFTDRARASGLVPSMGTRRGPLRQRRHRVVLVTDAGRAAQPAAMEDPHRAGQRDLRVPRDLPQPTAATPPSAGQSP